MCSKVNISGILFKWYIYEGGTKQLKKGRTLCAPTLSTTFMPKGTEQIWQQKRASELALFVISILN